MDWCKHNPGITSWYFSIFSRNTRIKAQNERKTVSSYVDRKPSVSVNRVVIQPRARQTTQKFRQQKQKGSMPQTRGNGCCMAVERTLLQRLKASPSVTTMDGRATTPGGLCGSAHIHRKTPLGRPRSAANNTARTLGMLAPPVFSSGLLFASLCPCWAIPPITTRCRMR